MADQNTPQAPQVGVVGRQGQQQQTQAPAPAQAQAQAQTQSRGIPGAQPPPVPSAEQIQKVMAEQQRINQSQAAEAQRRAAEMAKTSTNQEQPPQATGNPQGQPQPFHQPQPQPQPPQQPQQQIPPEIQAQMPPQMLNQQQQPPQPGQPNEFIRHSQPKEKDKLRLPWFPIRSKGVDVELTDSIITLVPDDGIAAEGDPQAKVVLALFAEILALRERVSQLASAPQQDQGLAQRVYQLEMTLFEQRKSLNSNAREVREQIDLLVTQGFTSDQILEKINGIKMPTQTPPPEEPA